MRILHLIQELGIGGAERMTAGLIAGARRVGHEVAVAAADGPLAAELNVPIFPLPIIGRRVGRLPAAARAVRSALRDWSPDVVHCHNPGMALTFALATMGQCRRRGVVTLEGADARDYRAAGRLLRWIGMPLVACGPGVAALLAQHGVAALTIANGVSAPPTPAQRATVDNEWPRLRGRRLLLGAGRLVAQKRYALAIEALMHIPDTALLLLGDGPERAILEREARRRGVGERVVLAGFRPDVREMLGVADVLVIPSLWEGLPLVALEALAAGCPIVAAKAPWQHEFLTDGRDSLLVEPDDVSAFAAAVRRVLDDGALAAHLSANALRLASSYREESTVDGYLRLYDSVLSS